MIKKVPLAVAVSLLLNSNSFAQGVGINDDGSIPVASTISDVKSTSQELLVPGITASQIDTIALLIQILKVLPEFIANQQNSCELVSDIKMTPVFTKTLEEQQQITERLQQEIESQIKISKRQQSEIENIKEMLGINAQE